ANLARALRALGHEATPFDIEQRLGQARRRADRAWSGSTASDAIPFLYDIPKHQAISLAPHSSGIPDDLAEDYSATDTALPGLSVVSELGREHRFPGSAVHVIGHMGRLSARYDRDEALLQGLDPEGWKGTSGLELVYDSLLHGVTGKRITLLSGDGSRSHIDAPAPGQDLRTTLDIELQMLAESALEHWYELAEELGEEQGIAIATEKMRRARAAGRGRAGMVLMDPWSGEILAMASRPGYHHEDLRDRYRELAEDPAQPLIDHSSSASFPPGSTMKVLVGMAAFGTGAYRVGESVHSAGHIGSLGDHAPAGNYTMETAIRDSSNVFFAKMALRMGPETVVDWFLRIGCGRKVSPDIPWQRLAYIVPTPDNIVTTRPREPYWLIGDTRRLGIGNYWSASPLEVVNVAATAATEGLVVRPHLVPGKDPIGVDKSQARDRISLGPAEWQAIRHGMEMATEPGGTAPYLRLASGLRVASKTGTSEWGSRRSRAEGLTPDHAWLIGYAPAENPVICFAIFVHSGTSGGRACSGVAKRVLDAYFAKYGPGGHAGPRGD
ncbi:MAG: penicillin-binding transpeptidase domain-containing protein, partial [Planctomycetota bacterium]